jgi:hypothetical protein
MKNGKTLIRVLTQYFDENGKAKGGVEFELRVDSDSLLYPPKDVLALTFQKLINAQMKNYGGRYEFLSYEPIFHEPLQLEGDFDSTLNLLYPNEK